MSFKICYENIMDITFLHKKNVFWKMLKQWNVTMERLKMLLFHPMHGKPSYWLKIKVTLKMLMV